MQHLYFSFPMPAGVRDFIKLLMSSCRTIVSVSRTKKIAAKSAAVLRRRHWM